MRMLKAAAAQAAPCAHAGHHHQVWDLAHAACGFAYPCSKSHRHSGPQQKPTTASAPARHVHNHRHAFGPREAHEGEQHATLSARNPCTQLTLHSVLIMAHVAMAKVAPPSSTLPIHKQQLAQECAQASHLELPLPWSKSWPTGCGLCLCYISCCCCLLACGLGAS